MRNWSEYTWLLNHMVATGFIKTIREIWWDVRPHHNFGTVEVRICDMPPTLRHVLGLTALVQCLVYDLSQEIDRGTYQYDCHRSWSARTNGGPADMAWRPSSWTPPPSSRSLPGRSCTRWSTDSPTAPRSWAARRTPRRPRSRRGATGAAGSSQTYRETGDLAEVVRQDGLADRPPCRV